MAGGGGCGVECDTSSGHESGSLVSFGAEAIVVAVKSSQGSKTRQRKSAGISRRSSSRGIENPAVLREDQSNHFGICPWYGAIEKPRPTSRPPQ